MHKEALRSIITINLRDIFTAPCIMILRREIHIKRVIVIVVLKVEPVLGPGIARAYLGLLNGTRRQPRAILGPKYARAIPGPKTGETFNTTIAIPQVM